MTTGLVVLSLLNLPRIIGFHLLIEAKRFTCGDFSFVQEARSLRGHHPNDVHQISQILRVCEFVFDDALLHSCFAFKIQLHSICHKKYFQHISGCYAS